MLLALLLAPRPAAGGGTICSNMPSACNGTYNDTGLYLRLGGLSGAIPTQLGLLDQLGDLELENNVVSGAIPTQLGLLHKLDTLWLYNNSLDGAIPTQLGLLDHYSNLQLNNNSLDGAIPTQLCLLENLESLWLYNNLISGAIPTQLGLLDKPFQLELHVYNNSISGAIPTQLGLLNKLDWRLEALDTLWLSNNLISGAIPTQLGLLDKLYYMDSLYFADNSLSGAIPTELGRLDKLLDLELKNNLISGAIPTQLGLLGHLRALELDNNSVSGAIPTQLGLLDELPGYHLLPVDLGLPCTFISYPPSQAVQTSCAQRVCDGIPPRGCTAFGHAVCLSNDNSWLSGVIPTQLGRHSNLVFLELVDNSLSSTIPTQLGLLQQLTNMTVARNLFSGAVPSQLGLLDHLTSMALAHNSFSDTVPSQLGQLDQLGYRYLRDDSLLSGAIPTQLGLVPADLGLPNNAYLHYPPSTAVQAGCAHRVCAGIPPRGCTAFGPASYTYRPSLEHADQCVKCGDQTLTIVLLATAGALIPAALTLYLWAVRRTPDAKRWVATASLVVSHVQVATTLGALLAVEGSHVASALKNAVAAAFVNLAAVHPQCLFPAMQDSSPVYAAGAAFIAGLPLTFLLVLMCAKSRVSCRAATRMDRLQLQAQGTYSSPLSANDGAGNEIHFRTMDERQSEDLVLRAVAALQRSWIERERRQIGERRQQAVITERRNEIELRRQQAVDGLEDLFVIVFSLTMPSGITLGLDACLHPAGMSLYYGIPILVLEALFILKLLRHVRALQGEPYTALPRERLERRLNYLVFKYGNRAAYWQFLLWARQLSLILLGELLTRHDQAIPQAAVAFFILATCLYLHQRTQPYAFRLQNQIETWCAVTTLVFVLVGICYHLVKDKSVKLALDVSTFAVLLSPIALVWLHHVLSGGNRTVGPINDPLLVVGSDESCAEAAAAEAAAVAEAEALAAPAPAAADEQLLDEDEEGEEEMIRRLAWIKFYVKNGETAKALELGWDGDMSFIAASDEPAYSGQQPAAAGGAAGGAALTVDPQKTICRI